MSTNFNERSSSVAGLASLRAGADAQGTVMPGTVVGGSTPPSLLYAAARRRVDALIARHGADSPQVQAALMHWAAILDAADAAPTPSQRQSVTSLADAVAEPPAPVPADVITTPTWTDPESYEAVIADLDTDPAATTLPLATVRPLRRPAFAGSTR
ncbi:hypothetical protein [Cellulomonas palmilytica]|uniref:hypothetical protein n=1 Tax=Cellulomonas palmilytica TaxID=2608402 RepID=UPI001F4172DB|nr:hypothetical protein [Cellulomonas palmilytica]UJP39360.1 hypothetical protein F1D97_13595 [Cellulomonas palmilytica]